MHTEEEARDLWCPHVRHQFDQDTPPSNRVGESNHDGVGDRPWNHCVGSKCAMWRWSLHEPYWGRRRHDDPRAAVEPAQRPEVVPADWVFVPADEEGDAAWVEPEEAVNARRRGYCGLAGNPQDL